MAPPKKMIDEDQLKKLAAINCSLDEMSDILKISVDTLGRRYADVIKEGRSSGKMSLKRKMFDAAMNGNITMMIWLSKNMLGYTEKIESKNTEVSKEETEKLVKEAKKIVQEMEKVQ